MNVEPSSMNMNSLLTPREGAWIKDNLSKYNLTALLWSIYSIYAMISLPCELPQFDSVPCTLYNTKNGWNLFRMNVATTTRWGTCIYLWVYLWPLNKWDSRASALPWCCRQCVVCLYVRNTQENSLSFSALLLWHGHPQKFISWLRNVLWTFHPEKFVLVFELLR